MAFLRKSIGLAIAITLALFTFAVLVIYLDYDPGKVYASSSISIVASVVTFFFSMKDNIKNDNTTIVSGLKPRRLNVPAPVYYVLSLVVLIAWVNIFSSSFQYILDTMEIKEADRINITVFNGGYLFFGMLLPLSAVCAYNIGYKPVRTSLAEAFLPSILTFGVITLMTTSYSLMHGDTPALQVFSALLLGEVIHDVVFYGRPFVALITLAAGLVLVLFVSLWLWVWSLVGFWRFRSRFVISN